MQLGVLEALHAKFNYRIWASDSELPNGGSEIEILYTKADRDFFQSQAAHWMKQLSQAILRGCFSL